MNFKKNKTRKQAPRFNKIIEIDKKRESVLYLKCVLYILRLRTVLIMNNQTPLEVGFESFLLPYPSPNFF